MSELKLNSGPKLNAIVAKEVMGWKTGMVGTYEVWFNREGKERLLPDYSTDIAAAWEVVERMIDPDRTTGEQYGDFKRWVESYGTILTPSRKACRTICLAALRAVGYTE